jgi:hypothetical protein
MKKYRIVLTIIEADGFNSKQAAEMYAYKCNFQQDEFESWDVEEYEVDDDEQEQS